MNTQLLRDRITHEGWTIRKRKKGDVFTNEPPEKSTVWVLLSSEILMLTGSLTSMTPQKIFLRITQENDQEIAPWIQEYFLSFLLEKVPKGKVYSTWKTPQEHERLLLHGFQEITVIDEEWKTVMIEDRLCMRQQHKHVKDASLSALPDLLLIDGGKGQLSAVQEVLHASGMDIPLIALAKREEELFLPDHSTPLALAKDHPARFLLMRLRDEAHRSGNILRTKKQRKKLMQ